MKTVKTLLLASALVALGCRTTETRSLASPQTPLVRLGTQRRMWEVECSGERLGLVVLFQERGLARDSVYLVRNPWNQDLGLIDGLGRAYRYLPHCEQPAWVGTGTVALGAQLILGARSECELLELDPLDHPGPGSTKATAQPAAAREAEEPAPTADPAPVDPGFPSS